MDNIGIKIGALLMGFLLWLHVATEKDSSFEITLAVNEVILPDSLTLASAAPESLTVIVNGPGKQLLRSKWRRLGLRINVSNYAIGTHSVSLTPDNTTLIGSNNIITLNEIVLPLGFELVVDQMIEATVPIVTNIVAEADEGFAVSRISQPVPPNVTVRGARAVVSKLKNIKTQERTITGLRNGVPLHIPVDAPDIYGLVVEPDSVLVNIEVVPVKTRTFENIPVVIFNAPSNANISPEPPAVSIELTGPPKDIDLLNRNAVVASVDYRQLDSNSTAPLKVDCPTNFQTRNISAKRIRLIGHQ